MKLLDCRDGVAATGEREALAGGYGAGDGLGAGMEGLELEHAHGAVPDHRAGLPDDGGELTAEFEINPRRLFRSPDAAFKNTL